MYYLESLHHARTTQEFFDFCRLRLGDGPYALLEELAKSKFAVLFGINNAAEQIAFCKAMCENCSEETSNEEFIQFGLKFHPRVRNPLVQWMDGGRIRTGMTLAMVQAEMEKRKVEEGKDDATQAKFLAENHALWTSIKSGKITTGDQLIEFVDRRFPVNSFKHAVIDDGGPSFGDRFIAGVREGKIGEPAADAEGLGAWAESLAETQQVQNSELAMSAITQLRESMAKREAQGEDMQRMMEVSSKIIQFHESRKELAGQTGQSESDERSGNRR